MLGKAIRLSLLAGLLLAVSQPAAGKFIEIKINIGGESSKLAKKLAQDVDRVKRKFDDDRAALVVVQGPGGAPAYSREAMSDLIDSTRKNFDETVDHLKEPKLMGLKVWTDEEIGKSREKLAIPPPASPPMKTTAAVFSSNPTVAVFASFAGGRSPRKKTPPKAVPPPAPAPTSPTPPKPDPLEATTVRTSEAQLILNQVGQAIGRIFALADANDLEVDLWVGSTPDQRAVFRFWPQASAGGPPAPTIVKTNGHKAHIVRGLYLYKATLGSGPVTYFLPSASTGATPSLASERLDLVNGSPFFCCRFKDNYCDHVDDEKSCRP